MRIGHYKYLEVNWSVETLWNRSLLVVCVCPAHLIYYIKLYELLAHVSAKLSHHQVTL
jgi:hypothetical protein